MGGQDFLESVVNIHRNMHTISPHEPACWTGTSNSTLVVSCTRRLKLRECARYYRLNAEQCRINDLATRFVDGP